MTVSPALPVKNIGDPSFQFTAVAKNAAGSTCGGVSFSWSSSNAAIAQITPGGIASVPFSGNAADYISPANISTMTATAIGSGVQGQTTLTVNNPVDHVTITSAAPPTLVVCGSPSTYSFTAEARDSSDIALPTQPPISWTSSIPAVATISNTGQATAVDGTGSPTSITATAYGINSSAVSLAVSGTASIDIIISPMPPPPITVAAGSSLAFTASATGADGSVTWSVDGGSVNGTISPASPPAPANATTYTAPAGVPVSNPITVRATSDETPACSITTTVTIGPTFSPAPSSPFSLGGGQNPQALVMGQFNLNNNTNLGVAVANLDTNDVSILTGDGAGNLTLSSSISSSGVDPVSVARGFFDADANPDLVAVNTTSDTAAILMGNGDGTFTAASPATHATGFAPQSAATADFDLDGNHDVAVAFFGSTDGGVTILLSNGDGTFASSTVTLTPSIGPYAIAAGRIDGDLYPDLVVTDLTTDQLWVLLGDGAGGFAKTTASPITLPANSGPIAIVIADFDDDLIFNPDLAIVNVGNPDNLCTASQPANANKVTILTGDGTGGFTPVAPATPPMYAVGANPRAIATGDFNQDGAVDLVTANYCDDTVSILFGNNDGTFQPKADYAVATPGANRPTGVAVGDLGGSGFDDIAVSNSGDDSVSVLLNNN